MTDELNVLAELSDDDLDQVLRHLIMMRAVHKAVLYDTAYETSRIEAIRQEQRKRERAELVRLAAADELVRLAEADHMYDHYRSP
jgi:hypothetical protein